MIKKKGSLVIIIFSILIIQVLLYINNNQKINFRYFIWQTRELKLGSLISITFCSGLFVGLLLNKTLDNKKIIRSDEEIYNKEKDLESFENNEDNISSVEMPPQRDIRDPQPTISVNYRVIKDTKNDYKDYEENLSNSKNYRDDWNSKNDDW